MRYLSIMAALLLVAVSFAQSPKALVGKKAPELQLSGWLNGKTAAISKLRGKVVVLDFWAFW